MRKKSVFFLKLVVFLCLLACALNMLGTLLDGGADVMQAASSLNHLPLNSVDVFWLGTSHLHAGVVPQRLYDEYGITSAMVTGNAIGLDATYRELQEALLRQNPQVVVLDVYPAAAPYCYHYVPNAIALGLAGQYPEGNNAYNTVTGLARWLPLGSPYKPLAILDLALRQRIADESVIQVARFHARYGNISRSNFLHLWGENRITQSFGYVYSNERLAQEALVYRAYSSDAALEPYEQGYLWTFTGEQLAQVRLLDSTVASLDRIISLCEKNNLPLVLCAVPYVMNDAERLMYDQVAAYCRERGVAWVDPADTGLEGLDVMWDYGHLNYDGAVRNTDFWGEYLLNAYDLPDRRQSGDDRYAAWRENAGSDVQLNAARNLWTIYDLTEYLGVCATLGDDYLVLVAADGAEGLSDGNYALLSGLGFDAQTLEAWRAAGGTFAGVSRGGESAFALYEPALTELDRTIYHCGHHVNFTRQNGMVCWTVDGEVAGYGTGELVVGVYSIVDDALMFHRSFAMN